MDSDLDDYLVSPNAVRQSDFLADTALKPGDDIDGFTAIAFLGHGAFGEVWRVSEPSHRRELALKLFVGDGSARERFLAEARLLATIDHPNVVRALSIGEFRGHPYFTQELLRPLPDRLDARQVTALGLDLCAALDHLHSFSIVHRDLKPDNVLVAPDGHFVLADLGIAALRDDALADCIRGIGNRNPTLVGGCDRALGTPGYAAPEQMRGESPSPASDIHALGVLFNALFHGQAPFLWRLLIRRMTSTLPAFRYAGIKPVRRALLAIRYAPLFGCVIAAALAIALAATFCRARLPEWKPLPAECVETVRERRGGQNEVYWHIRLPGGGSYTRGDLIHPPCRHYDPATGRTSYHRSRTVIEGPGRFYAPHVIGAEVHLVSNVTLVTSSEPPHEEEYGIYFPKPLPADEAGLSLLTPIFKTEPGSKIEKIPH